MGKGGKSGVGQGCMEMGGLARMEEEGWVKIGEDGCRDKDTKAAGKDFAKLLGW